MGGRSNAVMAVYDGVSWTSQSLAPLPGLNGVFVEDSRTADVVGLIGSAASVAIASFDFTIAQTPTALTLHGVWGDRDVAVYAVGGRSSEQPFVGVALVRSAE